MKNWLDYLTDEEIMKFTKRKMPYDNITINRNENYIQVISALTLKYDGHEYEKEQISYYNAFGAGYIYKGNLVLNNYGEETKQWFRMMDRLTKNVAINGLTYLEAFEQAYEADFIDKNSNLNLIIDKKIMELKQQKQQNDTLLKENLKLLHEEMNSMRKSSRDSLNLIVKDILSQMSLEERKQWLKQHSINVATEHVNTETANNAMLLN